MISPLIICRVARMVCIKPGCSFHNQADCITKDLFAGRDPVGEVLRPGAGFFSGEDPGEGVLRPGAGLFLGEDSGGEVLRP